MSDSTSTTANSEIEALIAFLRANPFPEDLEEARAAIDSLGTPVAGDIVVENIDVNGVPCQMLTPPGADETRVVIYLHGGGYAFGSLLSYGGLASEIGRAANCCVLLVDYRLAPEHTFPAALEDSCKAYQWLLDKGYEAGKISLAGDSAGGCLVMVTLVALKQTKSMMPGAAVCISPWIDMKLEGDSIEELKDVDPMVTREALATLVNLYMAGQDLANPTASPLYADMTDFPPVLIQVGENEILLSDAERLAMKAQEDGVEVVLEKWPEMVHVWHLFYPMLREGRTAIARIGEFIREKTGN